MKNKFLLALTLGACVLTSCDMDLAPIGSIDDKTAMQSVNDAYRFRAGFYSSFRGFTSSSFFAMVDLQADQFNGLIINGNNYGEIANGKVLSSTGDIASWWLTCYNLIADVNYFLENVQPILEEAKAQNNDEDIFRLNLYIGEAHFFRAYYYAEMFDRWCQVYSPEKGDQPGLGLPIVTVYNPTDDRSSYPGRSTMNETIKFIKDDFNKALEAITAYEEVSDENLQSMANYLSSYAIKAMMARFALWISDYNEAYTLSKEIIDSGLYPLSNTLTYAKLWTGDTGTELIMLPYEDTDELASPIGSTWIKKDTEQAWYIPTSTVIEDYASSGKDPIKGERYDVRYESFIKARDLKAFGVTVPAPCFYKYPGNPLLETSSSQSLYNKPKPFRTSESYLIAAEAAYMLGDATAANELLNNFCKARIKKYKSVDREGSDLIDEIRRQRSLELIGEGFRISDLRRWKMGFNRGNGGDYTSWPDASLILTETGLKVVYTTDDHRYTWPIPADEFQSNPQIAGQQNPGY